MDRHYFARNPIKALKNIIKLLEHFEITFDLYTDEKKMSDIYDFLHNIINSSRSVMSRFSKLLYTLNQWKMHLFRFHSQSIKKTFKRKFTKI